MRDLRFYQRVLLIMPTDGIGQALEYSNRLILLFRPSEEVGLGSGAGGAETDRGF